MKYEDRLDGNNMNFIFTRRSPLLALRFLETNNNEITSADNEVLEYYEDSTNSHDFKYRVKGWQNILGFRFNDIKTPVVTEKLTVERDE